MKSHIGTFLDLWLHRLRPVDGNDELHSDDIGDEGDEELAVSREQPLEALDTRIG